MLAVWILLGFVLLGLYSLGLVYLTARICGKDVELKKRPAPTTRTLTPKEADTIRAKQRQARQDRVEGIDG